MLIFLLLNMVVPPEKLGCVLFKSQQYPHVTNFQVPPSLRAKDHSQVYSSSASQVSPPFLGERKLLLNIMHCVKTSLWSFASSISFNHEIHSALLQSSDEYERLCNSQPSIELNCFLINSIAAFISASV